MKKYINEAVKKVSRNISFSTPGHKGIFSLPSQVEFDVTETIGTDNLLHPQDVILKSMENLKRIYGSKKSYYLTGGSTISNHIALKSITKEGDRVLIERNAHRSILNGCILNKLKTEFMYPSYDKKTKLFLPLSPQIIESYLKKYKDIKLVILTSPTYYGMVLNIREIAEVVHKYGAYLLVDEAHGSHLNFLDKNLSALSGGADIIVQSPHKTLPCLTGSSFIHVGSSKVNIERLEKVISMISSTSPSYLMLLSMERALEYMEEEGRENLKNVLNLIKELKNDLKDKYFFYESDFHDPTKLLFAKENVSGSQILRELFKKNIRLEMADINYALALVGPVDSEKTLVPLKKAMREINLKEENFKDIYRQVLPEKIMEMYETFERESQFINYTEAAGRISADTICPYPPGSPIIVPGELIDQDVIDTIGTYLKAEIEVTGINKNLIEVIK